MNSIELKLRYCSQYPLPDYRYIPGKGMKDEHRQDLPHFKAQKLNSKNWTSHEAYLYGIDLFNHAFLFEAHEVWEELWFVCGTQSQEGQFLKSLIQLAAAQLKLNLQQSRPAERLMETAKKILEKISSEQSETLYLGLSLTSLIEELKQNRLPSQLKPKQP